MIAIALIDDPSRVLLENHEKELSVRCRSIRMGDLHLSTLSLGPPLPRRCLAFHGSPDWQGWFCRGCSWKRELPKDVSRSPLIAREIECEFDAHDCADFL